MQNPTYFEIREHLVDDNGWTADEFDEFMQQNQAAFDNFDDARNIDGNYRPSLVSDDEWERLAGAFIDELEHGTTVLLAVEDRQGYTPAQVSETMTLGELLAHLEEAVELYGEDARVILDSGDRHGASFGGVSTSRDLFRSAAAVE